MTYRQKQAKFTILATKNLSLALSWQLNSMLFKLERNTIKSDGRVFLYTCVANSAQTSLVPRPNFPLTLT